MMYNVNKNVVHFELVQVSEHMRFPPLYDMVTLLKFVNIYLRKF